MSLETKIEWGLALLAFLLYASTIGFGYALDDRAVTFNNEFVKQGFKGFPEILTNYYWKGFGYPNAGLFRPLSLLLFAVEWQFAPDKPAVYHFVNVMLYAGIAFVAFRFLRTLLSQYNVWLSAGVVALWLVMPVHTEVVANIKSADELLMTLFSFLFLESVLMNFRQGSMDLKSGLKMGGYLLLALLSKEGAILLLPLAVVMIYLFEKASWNAVKLPVVVMASVAALWLVWHRSVIAAGGDVITYSYHDNALVGAPDRASGFATAVSFQLSYLQKILLGFPLSYDYSFKEFEYQSILSLPFIAALILIVGLIYAAIRFRSSMPVISFGILWYAITFALTANIITYIGATFADRFAFLPSFGVALCVAFLLYRQSGILMERKAFNGISIILLPLMLVYSVQTYARAQDWKAEDVLFTADAENAPGSARVNYNYGTVLMSAAEQEKNTERYNQLLTLSAQHLQRAIEIDSGEYQALWNLGVVQYRLGNYRESIKWSKQAQRINPKDYLLLVNMADAYVRAEQPDSAIVLYNTAIAQGVYADETHDVLGYCYLITGDTVKAISTLRKSVSMYPKRVKSLDKLANVLGMHKEFGESNKVFMEIAELEPGNPAPWKMVATNYLAMKDTVNAEKYWAEYQKRGGR
jgi:tetratricopeptide (TPR) repeat protein